MKLVNVLVVLAGGGLGQTTRWVLRLKGVVGSIMNWELWSVE